MTESSIDIGSLINFVVENKKVSTTTNICRESKVNAEDPKSLVKIINYLINYLKKITNDAIDITLKEQSAGYLLCFIISTNEKKLPPLSDKLNEALKSYKAAMRVVFEEGKYAQVLISFCHKKVPDSVVIEV